MDKTEMYNKIINAIDVLSRVEGDSVERVDVTYNWESVKTVKYRIGDIHILKRGKRSIRLFVNYVDVTEKVEKVDAIYRTLLRIYERQQEQLEESYYEDVSTYLNSFVGK